MVHAVLSLMLGVAAVDPQSLELLVAAPVDEQWTRAEISPDGRFLYVRGDIGRSMGAVVDVATGMFVAQFDQLPSEYVGWINWSPDSEHLVGRLGDQVVVYSPRASLPKRTFPVPADSRGLGFSQDGKAVWVSYAPMSVDFATSLEAAEPRVYFSLSDGKRLSTRPKPAPRPISPHASERGIVRPGLRWDVAKAMVPSNLAVLGLTKDPNIVIVSRASGQPLPGPETPAFFDVRTQRRLRQITDIATNGDFNQALGLPGDIYLRMGRGDRPTTAYRCPDPPGATEPPCARAPEFDTALTKLGDVSPRGDAVIGAALPASSIALFDPRTLQLLRPIATARTNLGVAVSPDGRYVAQLGWRAFRVIDVIAERVVIDEAQGDMSNMNGPITFSADGRTLFVRRGYRVKVYELPTGRVRFDAEVAFDRESSARYDVVDGDRRLVLHQNRSKGPDLLRVVDLATGRSISEGALPQESADLYSGDKPYLEAVTPSGRFASISYKPSGAKQRVRLLWDLAAQKVHVRGPETQGTIFRACNDARLVVADGAVLSFFDMTTAASITRVTLPSRITDVRCEGDGVWVFEAQAYSVFDPVSGARTVERQRVAAGVSPLRFSGRAAHHLTSDADRIDLFEGKSGRRLRTYVLPALHEPGEVGVVLADNRYAVPKWMSARLGLRDGDAVYGIESFDLLLHRPDLVALELGRKNAQLLRRVWERRLRESGVDAERLADVEALPTVELKGRDVYPAVLDDNRIELSIVAKAIGTTLASVHVLVDDVPVLGQAGRPLTGARAERKLPIDLPRGASRIQVFVRDARGASSLRQTLVLAVRKEAAPPRTLVFAIGVSRYQDATMNLDYAAKDARDFAAFWQRAGASNRVRVLTDDEVTKESVIALRRELEATTVEDKVIVFFAGHGVLDDRLDYFLATHDTDFATPSARGLAYAELERLFDGIPASKRLLLLDACHSGEVDKEAAWTEATALASNVKARGLRSVSKVPASGLLPLMRELFDDTSQGLGVAVLSSAAGGQFALESQAWSNGVFTHAVLDGLTGRETDANGDGDVRLSELVRHVSTRVRDLTGGRQTPNARQLNDALDFIVAKGAGPKP